MSRRRKLSAILMADVSGFSRMMGANEATTVDRIQGFHAATRRLVEEFEGRVVDTAGDSVLAEFDSVVNAVECAQRMQDGDSALATRIGIHLGDVIVEDYRVYGDGVNIAARLEPLADPGGLCISEAVYREVRGKLDLHVEELGLRELKNIEHPIRLYKVPPVRPAEVARTEAAVARGSPSSGPSIADFARPTMLVPACVGIFLMASEWLLFPSAGAVPAVGTILVAVVFGLVLQKRQRGALFLALGAGLCAGAFWTDWSPVTNVLFVFAGVIVAALGVGAAMRKPRRGRGN